MNYDTITLIGTVNLHDKFNVINIWSKEPTLPSVKNLPATHAHFFMESFLHDINWINWEKKTHNFKLKMFTGYGFNPIRKDVHIPDLDIPIKEAYNKIIINYLSTLEKNLGKEMIKKKNSNCYFLPDSDQYLEYDDTFTGNHEFVLEVNYSEVVTKESGNKRVKLYQKTQSVHKTGEKITTEQFLEKLKALFETAFNVIVTGRFNECLGGK